MDIAVKAQLKAIVSPDHFTDSREDSLCYSYDATRMQYLPEAVLFPADTAQVSEILKTASRYRFQVVPRGKGSGFSAGALPIRGGVVLDMHRFDRILDIDADNLVAEVQPAW